MTITRSLVDAEAAEAPPRRRSSARSRMFGDPVEDQHASRQARAATRDPAVVETAQELGVPAVEVLGVEAVSEPAGGRLVTTEDGLRYFMPLAGQTDPTTGLPAAAVYVYDRAGGGPLPATMALPKWPSAAARSGPWYGVSFDEVADPAEGIAVPIAELRTWAEVDSWIGADPVRACAYWVSVARAAGIPAAEAPRQLRIAAHCRDIIAAAGVTGVPA